MVAGEENRDENDSDKEQRNGCYIAALKGCMAPAMRTVVLGGYTGVVVTTGATVEESLERKSIIQLFP